MRKYSILVLVIALGSFMCSQKELPFTLIEGDQPCPIIVNIDPFDTVSKARDAWSSINWFDYDKKKDEASQKALAASELQTYLCRITGAPQSRFPIVQLDTLRTGNAIYLGQPDRDMNPQLSKKIKRYRRSQKSHSSQEFRIDTFQFDQYQGLVLSGSTATGILYAVYEVLHGWGVRWYTPDEEGEHVPTRMILELSPTHRYFTPKFAIRGYWIDGQRSDKGANFQWIQWLGRNRINVFSHRTDDIGALKQRGVLLNTGRQDVYSTMIKPEYTYRYHHPGFQKDDQYPIDPYILSPLFKGDVNGDDILSYGEAHPEWFMPITDSLETGIVDTTCTHICLSHTDAVKELSSLIVDKLRIGEWQTCDIVDLWSPEIWCPCKKCQQMGNDADKLLYLLYHVNKAVQNSRKKGLLQRQIYTHGYLRDTLGHLPSVELPRDFTSEYTALFLNLKGRCYNHYIISPQCIDINIWYSRDLLHWLSLDAIYKGNVYIAENFNAEYFRDLPVVHSEIMRIDIPAYAELGFKGINFRHPRLHDLGTHSLLNYQYAQQVWNPDIDIDSLRTDFFNFYYPGVEELVRNFYDSLERAMVTINSWRYYLPRRYLELLDNVSADSNATLILNERFSPTHSSDTNFNDQWENTYLYIHEARYILNQALSIQVPTSLEKRLNVLAYQLQYAEMMINLYDSLIIYLTYERTETDMRQEALLRLEKYKTELETFTIQSPLFGITNGLEASGVTDIVNALLNESN